MFNVAPSYLCLCGSVKSEYGTVNHARGGALLTFSAVLDRLDGFTLILSQVLKCNSRF